MIRSEKADFPDSVLRLFNDEKTARLKDLRRRYKHDSFMYCQTEKHLKILESDGMIKSNILEEYCLQPLGRKVLNDIDNLGYLAKHRSAAVETVEQENKGYGMFVIIGILGTILTILFLLIDK